METPAAGAVVLLQFRSPDGKQSGLRPALVLAHAARDQLILCRITRQSTGDPLAIELDEQAFATGGLRRTGFVRPGKLFTAHTGRVTTQVGTLATTALLQVADRVIQLLREAVPDTLA